MANDRVETRIVAPRVLAVSWQGPPVNCLESELLEALHQSVEEAQQRVDVKVVIFKSGLPNWFATGDVNVTGAICSMIDEAPWISIASVDGAAVGAGADLALACTLQVGGAAATFAEASIKRLRPLVAPGLAQGIVRTGRLVGAQEAVKIGMIQRLAPRSAFTSAMALAAQLSVGSMPAHYAVRHCVDAFHALGLRQGSVVEANHVRALIPSAEAAEGIGAFLQKRAPHFK